MFMIVTGLLLSTAHAQRSTTYVSFFFAKKSTCRFQQLFCVTKVRFLYSGRAVQQSARDLALLGRNYPFASFAPRFWFQEIVEELDNSTVVSVCSNKLSFTQFAVSQLLFSEGVLSLLQFADTFALQQRRPDTDRRKDPLNRNRPLLDKTVDSNALSTDAKAQTQDVALEDDDPNNRPQAATREWTREAVYGAHVERVSCDTLDELQYESQRPFSHVRCFARYLCLIRVATDGSHWIVAC